MLDVRLQRRIPGLIYADIEAAHNFNTRHGHRRALRLEFLAELLKEGGDMACYLSTCP